jgi:hypothetical protein
VGGEHNEHPRRAGARDRLRGALGALETPPAPVSAVIGKGRLIRIRRRITVAVSVVVLVALGIGLPRLLSRQVTSSPPIAPHYSMNFYRSITVNFPGPHWPAGLIGSGTIDRVPWSISLRGPHITHASWRSGTRFPAGLVTTLAGLRSLCPPALTASSRCWRDRWRAK